MKDYYDIWALSREFDFDGAQLSNAILATFRRRKTALPADFPVALSREFFGDPSKQRQWAGFIKRGRLKIAEADLEKVVGTIRTFLEPALAAVTSGAELKATWPKRGPWKEHVT